MASPSWIIAIATSGRTALLRRTLLSLCTAGVAKTQACIVVAENGGTAATLGICDEFRTSCQIEYIRIANVGKTVTLNEVLKAFPQAFIWFLDDDVRVTSEAVSAYDSAFKKALAGHEYYGGPLAVDYEREPEPWLLQYLPRSAVGWSCTAEELTPEATFLGANWAAWASDLLEVGGFDVALGPGHTGIGDEEDIQYKLRANGLKPVYLERALVYHWVPRTRCSPAWALRRAFYVGRLESQRRAADDARLFGFPRWTFKELSRRFLSWAASRFCHDPKRRFHAAYELSFFLGWMAGSRIKNSR